jgi:hypothetical protein
MFRRFSSSIGQETILPRFALNATLGQIHYRHVEKANAY